jgi:hypothetical protein
MTLTPAQLLEWLTDRAQQQRNEARSFENAPWVGAGSAALFCREEADTLDAIAALLQHVEALEARNAELTQERDTAMGDLANYENGHRLTAERERDTLREALTAWVNWCAKNGPKIDGLIGFLFARNPDRQPYDGEPWPLEQTKAALAQPAPEAPDAQ